MKYTPSPNKRGTVSSMKSNTNNSGLGFSVDTPPGSVRSINIKNNQSSRLVKYIKGYLLILFGSLFIILTLLNILFGVGEGTLLMHYITNLGMYIWAVLPIFFPLELGLKIFKHN